MAIPPPPGPPRPPPPPAMGGLKLGGNNTTGSSDARSALLQSIQKGTKLKKTVTVDKSAPVTTGKVVDGSDVSSMSSKRVNTYRSSSSSTQPIANGGPKLAGLFEGMTSMPKLKPVSSRDNVPSSRNMTTSTTTSNSIAQEIKENKTIIANNSNNSSNNNNNSNINNNMNNNNNGPLDFNAELTKHLAQTLKRQQRHQQSHVVNATEANLRTNRGPPPKPPIQKNMSSSTSDSVLEKSSNNTSSPLSLVSGGGVKASSPTLSEGSNSSNISNNSTTTKKNPNLSLSIGHSNLNSGNPLNTTTKTAMNSTTPLSQNVVPNKSRLFGTLNNSSNSGNISSSSNNNINSTSSKTTINNSHQNHSLSPHTPSSSLSLQTSSSPLSLLSSSSSSSSKPVLNHGKPNCAPKPPGIQQLISNGGKPTVSRHHSMKSPRSPPITAATSGTSVFSTAQYFGTLRGPQQQFNQSQESITTVIPTSTVMRQAPNPPIGRPTEAPPKPPSLKPAPPPIPARSVSNTNLTNLPLSTVSSGSSTTNLNTSFGSTNNVSNVSAIKEQLKSQISYTGSTSNVSAIKSTNQLSNTTTMETNLGVSNLTVGGSTGKLNSPIHSSSTNSNSRGENYPQKPSNLNGMSPPVPSHRTQPAPDPPQRQILNNTSLVPPKPPERHSSMRSNSAMTTTITGIGTTNLGKIGYHSQNSSGSGSSNVIGGSNNNNTTTNSGVVNRLVVDIELKYRSNFHNVTEFPTPPPFLNFPKLYPSRTLNNAEIRKPRAPSPPSNRHQRGYNIDQLNEQNT